MSTRRLLAIIVAGFPAAFAAGWHTRPASIPLSVKSAHQGIDGTLNSQGATSAINHAPAAPPGIQPLTCLDDIMTLLGSSSTEIDEMAGLGMMELAPRLVITSLPITKSILTELKNSPTTPQGELRQVVALGLVMRWLIEQPESALSYSFENPDLLPKSDELKSLGLAFLAKKNPAGAQNLISQLPTEEQPSHQKTIGLMQALQNPALVLTDFQQFDKLHRAHQRKLAARWMELDLAACTAWLHALPPEKRDPQLVGLLAVAGMKKDLVATLDWISAMPEGNEKQASRALLITNALTNVKDNAGLEAILARYPVDWHDSIRLKWMQNSSGPRGGNTAQNASQLKGMLDRNQSLAGDFAAREHAASIARDFAREAEFTAGSEWTLSLPTGPAQAAAAYGLVAIWAVSEPADASRWITQLPDSRTRDQTATSLIEVIKADDPASALIWAQSLSTTKAQKLQAQKIFRNWFERRPLEAAAAVQDLPDEVQQRIFSK